MKLHSLKYMTQAGGKLSEEAIKYFLDYSLRNNIKFYVMYGQNEATARISYVPFEILGEKIASIRIPIPNGKIKLFNDNEEVTEESKEGEIVYYGPNVMTGYVEHRNDLQKGDALSGKLRTGDLAFRDKDNFYFITGRLSRFIKIFGLRINLDKIEKYLQNNFQIPLVCIGKDELLQIVLQGDDKSLILKIKQKVSVYCKLKPYCISVSVMKVLPIKSSGKIGYKKLQEVVNHI